MPCLSLPAYLTLKDHQIARCDLVCRRHGSSIFRILVASPRGVQARKLDKQDARCVPAFQKDRRCLAFDKPRSIAAGDRGSEAAILHLCFIMGNVTAKDQPIACHSRLKGESLSGEGLAAEALIAKPKATLRGPHGRLLITRQAIP